jgi:hypothetical protein
MLLHVIEAPNPIDIAANLLADPQAIAIDDVNNASVGSVCFIEDVENVRDATPSGGIADTRNRAGVERLSTRGRIERSPVEADTRLTTCAVDSRNRGFERPE